MYYMSKRVPYSRLRHPQIITQGAIGLQFLFILCECASLIGFLGKKYCLWRKHWNQCCEVSGNLLSFPFLESIDYLNLNICISFELYFDKASAHDVVYGRMNLLDAHKFKFKLEVIHFVPKFKLFHLRNPKGFYFVPCIIFDWVSTQYLHLAVHGHNIVHFWRLFFRSIRKQCSE